MADEPETLTPRQHHQRALREKRERRAAQERAEGVPHPDGCLCYECQTQDALAWHARMARLAPRHSITEFSAFAPWRHARSRVGGGE